MSITVGQLKRFLSDYNDELEVCLSSGEENQFFSVTKIGATLVLPQPAGHYAKPMTNEELKDRLDDTERIVYVKVD